jgi:hypothetical protein
MSLVRRHFRKGENHVLFDLSHAQGAHETGGQLVGHGELLTAELPVYALNPHIAPRRTYYGLFLIIINRLEGIFGFSAVTIVLSGFTLHLASHFGKSFSSHG